MKHFVLTDAAHAALFITRISPCENIVPVPEFDNRTLSHKPTGRFTIASDSADERVAAEFAKPRWKALKQEDINQ